MRKDIVFVVPDLGGGGAEKALVVIANSLSRKFNTTIVLFSDSGVLRQFVTSEVKIISIERNHRKILQVPSLMIRLRKILKKSDIVFCGYQLFTEFYVFLSCVGLKCRIIPVIQTNVSFMMKKIKIYNTLSRIIAGLFYNNMHSIICAGTGIKKDMCKNLYVKPEKINVIYNPLYFFKEKNNCDCAELTLSEPVFVTLARLSYQKRIDIMMEGFRLFREKTGKGSLIVLGDGDEKEKLISLCREYGLKNNILFPGFVNNISFYLKSASIFLLTSDVEGFGNVLIEAMYYDLPVISTDCTGPLEVLQGGEYGIIIPKGDSEKLCDRMIELYENPEMRKIMIQKGRERLKDFKLEKISEKYENII